MAAGLLEPTDGTVSIGGQPAGSLPARAATSYLGDQPVFYDDLSVSEHLEYVARLHGATDWEQRGTDLLELLGLADRADDLPVTFSRGMRQKAAIAIAFVRPFELLLVDEPFVGLDRTGREALLELLRRAHAGGAALVVATHELLTVAGSQRVIALRDGALVFDGPPADADIDALVLAEQREHCHVRAQSRLQCAPMYEFDSVSASSYEASSLAAKLTEKSADGWEVVAIVPAGSDITAFLKRESTGSTASTSSASTSTEPVAADGDGGCRRRAGRQRAGRVGLGTRRHGDRCRRRASGWGSTTSGSDNSGWGSTRRPARRAATTPAAAARRRRRSRPGGTPTRPAATSCATGTARPGPSTSRAPASSTPTLR